MFLCIFQIYKEHAAITVRWYSFQYTLDSLLWLLLGNGITEDLYFLMSLFFSFIHLNCPLVVKKKKKYNALCSAHHFGPLPGHTWWLHSPPPLPLAWGHRAGFWPMEMGKSDAYPSRPAHKPLQDLPLPSSSSSRASLRIQSWHCHKMGKSGSLGTFLPHSSNDENRPNSCCPKSLRCWNCYSSSSILLS